MWVVSTPYVLCFPHPVMSVLPLSPSLSLTLQSVSVSSPFCHMCNCPQLSPSCSPFSLCIYCLCSPPFVVASSPQAVCSLVCLSVKFSLYFPSLVLYCYLCPATPAIKLWFCVHPSCLRACILGPTRACHTAILDTITVADIQEEVSIMDSWTEAG